MDEPASGTPDIPASAGMSHPVLYIEVSGQEKDENTLKFTDSSRQNKETDKNAWSP